MRKPESIGKELADFNQKVNQADAVKRIIKTRFTAHTDTTVLRLLMIELWSKR